MCFQLLCSTRSHCVFKLLAVWITAGEESQLSSVLLCNEKIAQIVVILEHTVLRMPLLFKYIFHAEDVRLILLVSERSLGKGGFHFVTVCCALILKSLQLLQRKPLTFSPTYSVFFPQSCWQTG